MSFAFYSSGERDYDENGDLVYVLPQEWGDKDLLKNNSTNRECVVSVLPKELDQKYYISHRDKYIQGSREWWDWERLRQYAVATLDFFRVSFKDFVGKYGLADLGQVYPAFLMEFTPSNLESAAEKMSQAEWAISNQYSNNRRHFISNKMNKHKTVERLQRTAKLSWGYYYSVKGFFPVVPAMKVADMGKRVGSLSNEGMVYLYGICQKAKYHMLKLNKTVYSDGMSYYKDAETKSGTTAIRAPEIYYGVKMMDLFDLAMDSFSLPNSKVFETTLNTMAPYVHKISSMDPIRGREFKFYDNYTTMRRLLWKVKCTTNQCEEGYPPSLFPYDDALGEIFPDENRVDMYKRAVAYRNACEGLVSDLIGYDESTMYDVHALYEKFAVEVERAAKYYSRAGKVADDEV